jgi:hypothetical protein
MLFDPLFLDTIVIGGGAVTLLVILVILFLVFR